MSSSEVRAGMEARCNVIRNRDAAAKVAAQSIWDFVCLGADGLEKWRRTRVENLYTNAGLVDMASAYFLASGVPANVYVGLISGPSPSYAAGDVANSHAGWTEFTGYSQATRVLWTPGSAAGLVISPSASSNFSVNAGGDVAGGFLITENTKSGVTGVLISEVDLSPDPGTVTGGDTVQVTATITMSSV